MYERGKWQPILVFLSGESCEQRSLVGCCPWDYFPDKNTRVGCRFLFQGIFRKPGIKPASLALAGGFFTDVPLGKPPIDYNI